MTILAPSRANVRAISFPIPLAAPVITATLSFNRMVAPLCLGSQSSQIVEHDFPESQRQIGDVMARGYDAAHRQPGNVAQCMFEKLNGGRTRPRALKSDVLAIIAHKLAYPRRAIYVRDDLYHEIGFCEVFQQRPRIELVMLVAHRRRHAKHGAIVQGAYQGFALMHDFRSSKFFGKPPNLAPAGDWSMIVEIHGMHIASLLNGPVSATKPHRNHLTGFSVVAEARGVRHPDELVR